MKKILLVLATVVAFIIPAHAQKTAADNTKTNLKIGVTGYIPQKTGIKKNFSTDEIADYAFNEEKLDITPSNKFWTSNYSDYADYLKDQIITWMRAEADDPYLSEEDAEAMFREMPTRKAVGKVRSTGLKINQLTGEILGLAETIERDPYLTTDGLGEQEIYGKKGVMSCVCGNTHMGIETTQSDDEWEDEAPAPKKNTNSKKFTVPAGSEIVINNYNYAYGGDAKAEAKADAKNEAPKVSGYVDNNEDPQPIIRKIPKVVYEEEDDDETTTVVKKKSSGCNNCTTSDDDKWKKQMLRNARANTVANYIVPVGSAVLGAYLNGKWQKAPVNNYYNTINNIDQGGDGGDLPDGNDDQGGDGGDIPGDGGKLPVQRQSPSNNRSGLR